MTKLMWVPLALVVAASSQIAGGEYLAMRGEHGEGRNAVRGFTVDRAKRGDGVVQYVNWRNSCRPVSHVVAGHTLEYPHAGGYRLVSPFIAGLEAEPRDFLALLAGRPGE